MKSWLESDLRVPRISLWIFFDLLTFTQVEKYGTVKPRPVIQTVQLRYIGVKYSYYHRILLRINGEDESVIIEIDQHITCCVL